MVLIAARAISTRAKVVSAMPMRFIVEQLEGLAFRLIGLHKKSDEIGTGGHLILDR
jgi:hypothetical protein